MNSIKMNLLLLLAILIFGACMDKPKIINDLNNDSAVVQDIKPEPTKSLYLDSIGRVVDSTINEGVKDENIILQPEVPKKPTIDQIESISKEERVDAQKEADEIIVQPNGPIKNVDNASASAPIKDPNENQLIEQSNDNNKEKEGNKVDPIETPEVMAQTMAEVMVLSHAAFDVLLKKYVSATGIVDYTGFKKDEARLDAYLQSLADNHPSGWTRNKEMAYWINAYNAFTIKLILKNYPLASIMDLHSGKPWDQKWIKLGDNTYSLNNIENDIIRPKFNDARIHFAVNCAAKSCPSLYNRAWTESNLDAALDQQTKKFVNNIEFNQITASKAQVSKIFEWYAADFGDLKVFLNKYARTKINQDAQIEYLEYNWKLNE